MTSDEDLTIKWTEADNRYGLTSLQGDLLFWLRELVEKPKDRVARVVVSQFVSRDSGKSFEEVYENLFGEKA